MRSRVWSCVVVCGRAWSCVVVRGRSWSCVVVRGRAWSFVVVRGKRLLAGGAVLLDPASDASLFLYIVTNSCYNKKLVTSYL